MPLLPIEEKSDLDFNFEKGRSILAEGAELYVETPEGTLIQLDVQNSLSGMMLNNASLSLNLLVRGFKLNLLLV